MHREGITTSGYYIVIIIFIMDTWILYYWESCYCNDEEACAFWMVSPERESCCKIFLSITNRLVDQLKQRALQCELIVFWC